MQLTFLYQATKDSFIGTVFLISAGFSTVAFICSLYISLSLKGQRMSDIAAVGDQITEQQEKEKRLRSIFRHDLGKITSI